MYTNIILQVLLQKGILDLNVVDLLWKLEGPMTYESQCMADPGYSSQKNTLTKEKHLLSMVNKRDPKGLQ